MAQCSGSGSAKGGGQELGWEVLVGDGDQPAADGGRADRGGAGRGGGRPRAAVVLGATTATPVGQPLKTIRPATCSSTAATWRARSRSSGDPGSACTVRGQVAGQRGQHRQQVRDRRIGDHQPGRAEPLAGQHGEVGGERPSGSSWKIRGVAPHGPGPGLSCGQLADPGMGPGLGHRVLIAREDPAGQHRAAGRGGRPPRRARTSGPRPRARTAGPGWCRTGPAPRVSDPAYPVAIAAGRAKAAPGSTTHGLTCRAPRRTGSAPAARRRSGPGPGRRPWTR